MYKRIYGIAWKVTRRLYVRGYDQEDLVQECVLKTFLYLQRFPDCIREAFCPSNAYIAEMMRNHIYNMIARKRVIKAQEFIECYHVPLNSPVLIPVPSSDKMARRVVIALLENDMSITNAAADLSLTYHQTNGHWRRAKDIILSTTKVESMLRDETIYLAANF